LLPPDFRYGPLGDVVDLLRPCLLYSRKQTFLRIYEYNVLSTIPEGIRFSDRIMLHI